VNIAILAPRSAIAGALRKELAEIGAQFACIGRDLDGVEDDSVVYRATCELTDFDAVERALTEAANRMDGLHGVVNFAGSIFLKPAHLTSREDYDTTVAANLTTAFATARAAGRVLGKRGGSVVLLSSAAATFGMANHESIAAAKAGVEGLMRAAAATYAGKGIRFNVVAPGLVDTPLAADLISKEQARKVSESLHPLRRLGTPEDVARTVAWLLNPENAWITGQVIGVDGGLSRVQPRPVSRPGQS